MSAEVLTAPGKATSQTEPVYTLFHAPQSYINTLTPPSIVDARFLASNCRIPDVQQETRWIERTGVAPEDSRFTLGLPIHNEGVMLADSIATLMGSDIPKSVPMQVVLVTNGCTDTSKEQVKQFMEGLGEIQHENFTQGQIDKLADPNLNPQYQTVQMGAMTFIHIDTTTQGKANALNLVNAFALNRGDPIAVSFDTNNFLETDAIPLLYRTAHRSIVSIPDGTVLVSGNSPHVQKNSPYVKIKNLLRTGSMNPVAEQTTGLQPGRTMGALMAWDTTFVDEIGGFPQTVTEDYALGVKAIANGKKTKRVQEAKIWVYSPTRLRDTFAIESRYAMGHYQAATLGTAEERVVKEKDRAYPFLPLRDRIERIQRTSAPLPFRASRFLLMEGARIKGRHMFAENPDYQSWKPIGSTKGKTHAA